MWRSLTDSATVKDDILLGYINQYITDPHMIQKIKHLYDSRELAILKWAMKLKLWQFLRGLDDEKQTEYFVVRACIL